LHGRNKEREGNLKLECGCCAHCRGANKVILNRQRLLGEGDQEVAKRYGRNEPLWVATHKHMEATLGISLYSHLYLKLAKMLCVSYYLLCFHFNKIGEQEGETGAARKLGGGDMAQTMYTHVSKCKNNKEKKEAAVTIGSQEKQQFPKVKAQKCEYIQSSFKNI
jgi:hypothetical protein